MTTPRLTLALVVGMSVAGCSWNLGGSEETAPPTIANVDPPLEDPPPRTKPATGGVARFAQSIGVTHEALQGALAPSAEAPYLHLDARCWEAMKKALGQRGNRRSDRLRVARLHGCFLIGCGRACHRILPGYRRRPWRG